MMPSAHLSGYAPLHNDQETAYQSQSQFGKVRRLPLLSGLHVPELCRMAPSAGHLLEMPL